MIDAVRQIYRLLVPDEIRRPLLVRRRAPLWRKAGIVFVHIPKAAGTSINHAIYGRFMGHMHASEIKRWAPADVAALPMFCVTRNPWERLVSAYRFATRGIGMGDTTIAGMWRPEIYRRPEFRSFESFVEEWLVRQDVGKLDGVFQPQWMFVCDERSVPIVDHVGRMDDMRNTTEYLRNSIGLDIVIGRTNISGDRVEYRSFYNPFLRDVVSSIYRKDIETFGFDF